MNESGKPSAGQPLVTRCTAVPADGDARPNILFLPPCECPDCYSSVSYDHDELDDGWLRRSGDSIRHRVETVTLNEVGRSLLG